jgi:hypothetical protein
MRDFPLDERGVFGELRRRAAPSKAPLASKLGEAEAAPVSVFASTAEPLQLMRDLSKRFRVARRHRVRPSKRSTGNRRFASGVFELASDGERATLMTTMLTDVATTLWARC